MKKRGFTLVELLVVIMIIAILAVIALPQYASSVEKAKSAEAVNLLAAISQSAERYRMQQKSFPADLSKLDIELPGLADNKVTTKDFVITGEARITPALYTVTAARKTGKYNIYLAVDAYGNYIRCCGSTAPQSTESCGEEANNNEGETICNSITSGNSTNGKW